MYGLNLISRDVGGNKVYYLYNGHHDVVQLVTEQGVVVASFEYDAFGVIVEEEGDGSNPYRYSGYFYDVETMLYYIRCRYYDAGIARFLSEDSVQGDVRDPLSLNLYTYCSNNPLIYWDPTGHLQADDKDRPIEVQMELIALTNAWYAAPTQEEKDKIHAQADKVRSGEIKTQDYTYTKTDSKAVAAAQALTNAFAAQYTANGNKSVSATQYWNLIYDSNNNPRSSITVYTNQTTIKTPIPQTNNAFTTTVTTNTMTTFGTRTGVVITSSNKKTSDVEINLAYKLKNEMEAVFVCSMNQSGMNLPDALVVLDYLNKHPNEYLTGNKLRELLPHHNFQVNKTWALIVPIKEDAAVTASNAINDAYRAANSGKTLIEAQYERNVQNYSQVVLPTIMFLAWQMSAATIQQWASESGPFSNIKEPMFQKFNYNELKTGNKLTTNQSQLGHMFRNADGHFVNNTAANRAAIEHAAGYNKYFLGTDVNGTAWYGETLSNGTQVWAKVRNGVITEGGINQVPHTFNPQTGLSALR